MDLFPLALASHFWISSGYRTPQRPTHNGVDIAAAEGTPLYACVPGTIVVPPFEAHGAGNNIWILQDGTDVLYKYFHMAAIAVRAGQHVNAGDVVGQLGTTGNSTGPHLHVERHQGVPVGEAWTDPTAELLDAVAHQRFVDASTPAPPAPQPDEETMTPELQQALTAMETRLAAGVLEAAVKSAELVHNELDEFAANLHAAFLAPFSVNTPDPAAGVAAPTDVVPAPAPPA